jgi:16S rRNA G966 N2-methylase RsmD
MIPLSEETKKFIIEHRDDDVFTLAFQAERYPSVDFPTALTQIEGRQKIKDKLPSWFNNDNILYPHHLPLEQCSSEKTAEYKSSLISGDSLMDLTGGMGVDSSFMASRFSHVIYIEQKEELCCLAKNNFNVLGIKNINVINTNSIHYLNKIEHVDTIYVDPARRDEKGKKVYAISDCEPNIIDCEELLLSKADTILVKLSPMLDIDQAVKQLKHISEIHIVSVDNECKELLVILKQNETSDPIIHCINITHSGNQTFDFCRSEETNAECEYTSEICNYLYEPNVALLKAGAFKLSATRYKLKKLNPNSHLYTSNTLVTDFPGKICKVEGFENSNKKGLRTLIKGIAKANIVVRNFPISSVELQKRLKLKDGGDDYLYGTTISNGHHIIIHAKKVDLKTLSN